MRRQDLDSILIAHAAHGLIVGICGGMQMLGRTIVDPFALEHEGRVDAIGLLPFATRMNQDKVTRKISGRLALSTLFGQAAPTLDIDGYEIHIGETIYAQGAEPFSILNGHQLDGCISPDTKIFGTYLHGIFDNDAFRHFFIASARSFHSLAPAPQLENWKQKREVSFARLAETVRASLNTSRILDWAHPHVSTPGLTNA
jgi:adenosylcobyric acid synthase